MRLRFLYIALLPCVAVAQSSFPRDTSFTVHSAYNREVKKYPFIQLVKPLPAKDIRADENVVFRNVGRDLRLDVFHPTKKTTQGYPAVLLIHGGGWRSGDRSHTVPFAQHLAVKGYVAIAVEYRLSGEALYPAAVYDLKAAVRWLRTNASRYNIDTTRIAALGFSAGGQLAALLGTTNGISKFDVGRSDNDPSSSVQAIVDIDGIVAFKHPESAEGASASSWLGGTYEQNPDAWIEASALTHVGRHTAPVLFINSALPRFHAGRDDMIKVLDSLKIYSEVHTVPDTPHPFWLFHPWFEPTVNYVVAFLNKVF